MTQQYKRPFDRWETTAIRVYHDEEMSDNQRLEIDRQKHFLGRALEDMKLEAALEEMERDGLEESPMTFSFGEVTLNEIMWKISRHLVKEGLV